MLAEDVSLRVGSGNSVNAARNATPNRATEVPALFREYWDERKSGDGSGMNVSRQVHHDPDPEILPVDSGTLADRRSTCEKLLPTAEHAGVLPPGIAANLQPVAGPESIIIDAVEAGRARPHHLCVRSQEAPPLWNRRCTRTIIVSFHMQRLPDFEINILLYNHLFVARQGLIVSCP